MKIILSHIFCSSLIALCSTNLYAVDNSLSVKNIQCTKQELMSFFPKVVVKAVLTKNNIPENKAEEIADDLSNKDDEIEKMIQEKAAKLEPNPFEPNRLRGDLSQRDAAIKIQRESLFQEFSKVLKAHGITDDSKNQEILDELQRTKSKLFIECIRRQTPQAEG